MKVQRKLVISLVSALLIILALSTNVFASSTVSIRDYNVHYGWSSTYGTASFRVELDYESTQLEGTLYQSVYDHDLFTLGKKGSYGAGSQQLISIELKDSSGNTDDTLWTFDNGSTRSFLYDTAIYEVINQKHPSDWLQTSPPGSYYIRLNTIYYYPGDFMSAPIAGSISVGETWTSSSF